MEAEYTFENGSKFVESETVEYRFENGIKFNETYSKEVIPNAQNEGHQ